MDNKKTDPVVEEVIAEIKNSLDENAISYSQIMKSIREEAENLPVMLEEIHSTRETHAIGETYAIRDAGSAETIVNINIRELQNEAEYLKVYSNNPYYWDMGKGPKSLLKRLVRRLNKCIVFPWTERQNDFNLHTAKGFYAASNICNGLKDLESQITEQNMLNITEIKQLNEKSEKQVGMMLREYARNISNGLKDLETRMTELNSENITELKLRNHESEEKTEKALKELEICLEGLEIRIDNAESKLSETEQDLKESKKDISQLATRSDVEDGRIDAISNQADEVNKAIAMLQWKKGNNKAINTESEARIAEIEKMISKVMQENKEQKAEINSQAQQLEEIRNSIDELNQSVVRLVQYLIPEKEQQSV